MNSNWLHMVTWILIVVGALNWGLVGLAWLVGGGADWNVVHMLLGGSMQLEGIVYVLVGLSGVYEVATHKKNCRACGKS